MQSVDLDRGASRFEEVAQRVEEVGNRIGRRLAPLHRRLLPVLILLAPAIELAKGAWRALDRPDRDLEVVEPYVAGETPILRALFWPSVLGFVASTLIFVGATQPNSPFTYKAVGAWYFGIPTPSSLPGSGTVPGQGLFFGVVAVYGGMLLLIRAWVDVAHVTARHPGIPVARLIPVFCAWVAPLLVVAPLFSKDAYSYAAQGEMMTHGINPYHYGPQVLGVTPFAGLVDPLWQNVSSPYGPMFLTIAGWIVSLGGHNELFSVAGMRVLALIGTVMFAYAVPIIARSFGRDGSNAFVLAALNPLVLLHLVAGAHNDALMLGFLACGYALARRGHPLIGVVLCAFAAAVKVPAILGAFYIGWEWLGPDKSPRERLRPVATALLLALAVMATLSEAAGLGWGWISGLSNPDTVRSWLDPATGLALISSHLVSAIGLGNHSHLLITLWRGSGLLLAVVIGASLLWRSGEIGSLRALGLSLIAVVMLGPVVQPWYLTWGFVFLAPIAERRLKRIVLGASAIACFLGLPGGQVLLHELSVANPATLASASFVLVALFVVLVVPKLRKGLSPSDAILERV